MVYLTDQTHSMTLLYRLQLLVLAAFALLASATTMRAADEVHAPAEMSAEPGQIIRVALTGTISVQGTSTLTLEYPHQIVSVRTITGSGLYSYRCVTPTVLENTIIDADRSRLVIECTDVVPITNGTIVTIDFEFKAGGEATGLLTPTSLSHNGTVITDAVFTSGTVRRFGEGVIQDPNAEGITSIYPNPIQSDAKVAFVMRAPGVAHFQVRDPRGRLVQDLKEVSASAGQNLFDLGLVMWELGSGSYLLQLTTESGSYLYSFVVQK